MIKQIHFYQKLCSTRKKLMGFSQNIPSIQYASDTLCLLESQASIEKRFTIIMKIRRDYFAYMQFASQ